jgi:aldehyde:ferredoxin oxidoreductase
MTRGYMGRLLRVNLSDQKIEVDKIPEDMARKYLGGAGFAAKILWEETDSVTDPLSPSNPLLFTIGPLTGFTPSSSRYIVNAISPKTGIWGEAHAGGFWAARLKEAGYDGIMITGRAEKPVYLYVYDDDIRLRDATDFWGLNTYQTDEAIQDVIQERMSTAVIGRAGENLVNHACIISDGKLGRAAARSGLGAVMGSKNLKAVVVGGTHKFKAFDRKKLLQSITQKYPSHSKEEMVNNVRSGIKYFYTAIDSDSGQTLSGTFPVKNWLLGHYKGFMSKVLNLHLQDYVVPHFCRTCRNGCIESLINTKDGRRYSVYEAMAPMGSQCLVDDMAALEESYTLCQEYGLDTISTGASIAFGMECYEKGLITKDDTGGIELQWGNAEAMLRLVREIGEREGFGAILGLGVRAAAARIGGHAAEYALHVKGSELAAIDPRSTNSGAVALATSNGGGFHEEGIPANRIERGALCPDLGYFTPPDRFATRGKGELSAKGQNYECLFDSLTTCNFLFHEKAPFENPVQPSELLEWLNLVTGWNMGLDEFLMIGERIFNLKRMFNVRRGSSRNDDTLPARFLTHKLDRDGIEGNVPFLGEMLSQYYRFREWSEEGIPTKEKLRQLDLDQTLRFTV